LCFVLAILISSFIFGLGHLPVAVFLIPETTLALVLFVIVANSAFGLVAGYLYWKYGLEAAIIAHMLCHVLLATASYAGAYF
jgi:membrane protease YdiL (CAAX protease family)